VNSKVIPTNNLKLKKRYKTMVVQGGAEWVSEWASRRMNRRMNRRA
jgi:hypothetical protein